MAQPRSNDAGLGSGAGSGGQAGTMSQQNLNQIVCVIFLPATPSPVPLPLCGLKALSAL